MHAHTIPHSNQGKPARCVARAASTGVGWVFAVDRSMVDDPEGKSRTRAVQVDGTAAANGGFVKAPSKPTNHSKPAVGRAYKALVGKGEAGSGRGRSKFKHDEVKMYYLEDEVQGADDAFFDAMQELYY